MRSLGLLASLALAATALADQRTYTINFFPEEPVSNHISSLQFDPRLAEPFLAGAQIVGARLVVEFTPSDGFDPANLNLAILVPLADQTTAVWSVNGATDLNWTTPPATGPYTANISSAALNGQIPVGGRAIWFWDLTGDLNLDPPAFSGSFSTTSRVELDYLPIPQAIVTAGDPICPNQPATFNVRSSCAGAPTYQWQVIGGGISNWTDLLPGSNSISGQFIVNAAGVTADTLTVDRGTTSWPTALGSEFYFRCVVTTTECGPVESAEITPPVSQPFPAFTEIAFPGIACIGNQATLNVYPDGVAPFAFQWRMNGVPIDSAANPSAATEQLDLGTLRAAPAATYDCLVTDACGSTLSMPVSITVCAADFNCSTTTTVEDIFDFLNAWFAQEPRSDLDGNGVTTADIFDFLNAWFAGC